MLNFAITVSSFKISFSVRENILNDDFFFLAGGPFAVFVVVQSCRNPDEQ